MGLNVDRNGTQHPVPHLLAYTGSHRAHRASLRSRPHMCRHTCPGIGINAKSCPCRHGCTSIKHGFWQRPAWGARQDVSHCSSPHLIIDRDICSDASGGYYCWSGPINNVPHNPYRYGDHCHGYRQGHRQGHCDAAYRAQCQLPHISPRRSTHTSPPGAPPIAPGLGLCCRHGMYVNATHGLALNLLHNCDHRNELCACRNLALGLLHGSSRDVGAHASSGPDTCYEPYGVHRHWQYLTNHACSGCGLSLYTHVARNGAHHL